MVTKIECVEVHESAKEQFTVGSFYTVIRDLYCPLFYVLDDKGNNALIHRRKKKTEWYMFNAFFPDSSEHRGHVAAIFKYAG